REQPRLEPQQVRDERVVLGEPGVERAPRDAPVADSGQERMARRAGPTVWVAKRKLGDAHHRSLPTRPAPISHGDDTGPERGASRLRACVPRRPEPTRSAELTWDWRLPV